MKTKMKIKIIVILSLFLNLLSSSHSIAYEKETHGEITKFALSSALKTNDFLKELGLTRDDKLKENSVEEWFELGSKYEDNIIITLNFIRPRNHFFDPIAIDKKGLTVNGKSIGEPAPNWALEDPDIFRTQFYSIKDAKQNLFEGLTATNETERDKKLVLTFRALGQVLHLV